MPFPETRARLSKATFSRTLFRFLRKKNHNAPSPIIATSPIPPTTPPAIAPALDFELPTDVELGLADVLRLAKTVLDEDKELERLVLVATADEVVEVSLASADQWFSFHRSQPNLLHLPSSAAITLKLLFVYDEKIIINFSMPYYQIHSPRLS